MTTLVVQAHPLDESYNAALLDAAVARLAATSTQARIVRLCQGDSLVAEMFDDVTTLTAVYPTWWGSLPSIMLAELAKVLGPWIDGDQTSQSSPLRNVERLTAVTSHGSSLFINRLQGEPGKQLWKRTVLPLCAPSATFEWKALYKLDRIDAGERTAFLRQL